MSRRTEDWILDSILNPWLGDFFSLEDVLEVAGQTLNFWGPDSISIKTGAVTRIRPPVVAGIISNELFSHIATTFTRYSIHDSFAGKS